MDRREDGVRRLALPFRRDDPTSGVQVTEAQARLQREMADVSALLYGTGATLVLLSLLLPHWEGVNVAALVGLSLTAYVVGLAFVIAARRIAIPLSVFAVTAALGSVIVAAVVHAGGPAAAGTYGIFYVFVAAFAFYYFSLRLAIVEITIGAVAFGVALALLGSPAAPAEWLVIIGASGVGGGVIGNLGRQSRMLWVREQRAAVALRELDEMKMTFVQAVSHELRTPLTSVRGYAELLHRHDERLEGEKRAEILDRLKTNVERLEDLLGDLLDVDRFASGTAPIRRIPTDVGAVIRDVTEMIEFDSHPVHVWTETVTVPADRAKVERIVEHLVGNALRHTPHGKPIYVSATPEVNGAVITVEDRGPGIPDRLKSEVFEPFRHGPTAATAASPGAGVGLALVARFAEAHGGRVWVEDAVEGGSRFCVFLPSVVDADD
jgi:signal transduction histidine kinase